MSPRDSDTNRGRSGGGAASGRSAGWLRAAPLAVAAASLAAFGCASANAEERITLAPEDLPDARLTDQGQWESCRWSGEGTAPWTAFPGRTTLVYPHDLGRLPASVQVYLSFSEGGGAAGMAVGDLARIMRVTANEVEIKNATAGDYYARVVLF